MTSETLMTCFKRQLPFRMHYLASNFTHINWIVISTAASIFIFVTWIFPSLKKKNQPNKPEKPYANKNSPVSRGNKKQVYFRHAIASKIQGMAHFTQAFRSSGWATISLVPARAVWIQTKRSYLAKVNCSLLLTNHFSTTFQTSSSIAQLHKGKVHIYKEHSLIWLPAYSSPYSCLNRSFLNSR